MGGKSNQVDKEGLWISISVIACSLSRFEGDDHNIQGESDETHHFVHFQKSTSKLRSSMLSCRSVLNPELSRT